MIRIKPFIAVLACASVVSVYAAAGADRDGFTPPESLIIDGVPSIPASLADQLTRYTESRAATLLNWHPTKREMLISTRFGETTQIHQVKFPGGDRTQLTFFSDRVNQALYRSKTGDYFVFAKDTGGNDADQFYRYDLASRQVTLLTDGRSIATNPVWNHAGNQLVYASMRDGKKFDLFIIDPLDPGSDRLLAHPPEGGFSWPLDVSPDDGKVLILQFISAAESYLWAVDLRSGEMTALTPKHGDEKAFYSNAMWSRDGKGIYVITDRGSEFQRLAYLDLASRQHRFLTDHIKWDVGGFDLSPDGRLLAFVSNEDGIGRLNLIDVATGKEKSIPPLPTGIVSDPHWHENGRDLGFTMASAKYPNDVYSLDVQTGKVERWTKSETGGVNTDQYPDAELMRWPSDGRTISGFLYRPPKSRFPGKRPVLIDIHGGPQLQARPDYIGRNGYLINEFGIAVIYPNVRGSAGYGKSFLKLDDGLLRTGAIDDVGALLDFIKAQPDLDGERVMLRGDSYGGFLALACAAKYGERIRAVQSVSGYTNFSMLFETQANWKNPLMRIEYGDERNPKIQEFWQSIGPAKNAGRIKAPVFIIHGKNDTRVPLDQADGMVAALKQNGVPVWYVMGKDEGHFFVKKKNRDYQFFSTVMFVKEALLR